MSVSVGGDVRCTVRYGSKAAVSSEKSSHAGAPGESSRVRVHAINIVGYSVYDVVSDVMLTSVGILVSGRVGD